MSNIAPAILGTVSVNHVVWSILNRMKDYSTRNHRHFAQLVIEGYTELSLWHLNSIEVVYLRMSSAKTVDLPADFVDYTKIAIPVNGKYKVLTNNEKVLLPRQFADGEDIGNADDENQGTGSIFFVDHFRNGQFVAGLYGIPGGFDMAYYRVDRENRQIVFSGSIPRSEIVLEYISSGIKLSGTTQIPMEAVPSLRSYVKWVTDENDPKKTLNEKERSKRSHFEDVEALSFFQNAFTKEEYERHVWKHTSQSPRR